ncbi:MAG: hypothetical protein R3D44_04715 [Hyphomicrobiaceae bacterium]
MFWRDASLFYVRTAEAADDVDEEIAYVRPRRENPDTIEIGMIAIHDDVRSEALLGEFVGHVSQTAKRMESEDISIGEDFQDVPNELTMKEIVERSGISRPPRFVTPTLDGRDVGAIDQIAIKPIWELLIDISKSRQARKEDVLRSANAPSEKTILDLISEDLLRRGTALECKKTSAAILRTQDEQFLLSPFLGSTLCPNCGSPLSEERRAEFYMLGDRGSRLLRGNFWLTSLVTRALVEVGVSLESIWWNLEEGGGELDILASFRGQIWVFELKDREFGAGDAYPFNHRRERYRATQSVIITTDKVSSDAKETFSDMERHARESRSYGGRSVRAPIYIEGLGDLRKRLDDLARSASVGYVREVLGPVEIATGYSLANVLMGMEERSSSIRSQTNVEPMREALVRSE